MDYKRLLIIFCLGLLCFTVKANEKADLFTLANTLQSNMVIQQGEPLIVWGYAKKGQNINIRASWKQKTYITQSSIEGIWRIDIPVPLATPGLFTENTLEVSTGKKTLTLTNILFGDVWLCSGQSNMDMELKPFLPWMLGAMHYRMEIENARYPQIRLFNVPTDFKATPQLDCGGSWQICSPATAPDFSAVAYFFAREIFNKTRIPIGLVVNSVGGSSCQAWVSRDTLRADHLLNEKYLYPYDTSALSKELLDPVVTFEKVLRPTLFYNAMLYPLRNIAFKGALWYQGESNRFDSSVYTRLCAAMIHNWRNLFSNNKLPFYYVQVAPYNWQEKDPTRFEYALLREAQANIRNVTHYTEMALTMDIAEPSEIHPRNKQDVGYRLSRIALAKVYNRPETIYTGPEYVGHRFENGYVKITFKHTGSGLATNDGGSPKHFYLAGKDRIFYYAEAKIENNEIWVKASAVLEPVAIRYAFTNYPVTNLENKEGFPAVPFRSSF